MPHTSKLTRYVLLVGFIVVLGGLTWFLTGRDPTRRTMLSQLVTPGAATDLNVLLITLDTTRADHLGCYGYAAAQTPTIDSLLENGVRFDDAVTSVPTTLASHATILTGLYPPSHGVRDNGTYQLEPEFETLAEVFQGEGFDTAAFVSCFVLDERFGLAQGFDEYEFEPDASHSKGPASLEHERRADDTTDSAIEWLETQADNDDKPFFAWVHYFDPHFPYEPPVSATSTAEQHPYDAEISFVDGQIKRLLETLEAQGRRDNTLIVLVTDHGEGLFDHGEGLHGIFLYESTMRVAWILSNPKLFDRAYRVDNGVVGTVDIAPTLRELWGLTPASETDGQSLVTSDPAPDRAIYIESLYPLNLGCSEIRGMRRHDDKFILAPRPEYYDLADDPDELSNQYDADATQSADLCRQLEVLCRPWDETIDTTATRRTLSDEETRRLGALGYVSTELASDGHTAVDAKDRIEQVNELNELHHRVAHGEFESALDQARSLAEQSPGWSAPTLLVAEILLRTERHEERAAVLAEYCSQHPTAEMLFYLAHAQLQLNQFAACDRTLREAQSLDDGLGALLALRGDLLFAQERYAEAAEQYQLALDRDAQRLGSRVRLNLREARKRAAD